MEIIDYFTSDKQEYWLEQIAKSNWQSGTFLAVLLRRNELKKYVGENTKLLLLIDGTNLVSYCTFADYDDIQPTELTPWIGWVYTYPEYRHYHYAGLLLAYAEELAKRMKIENIYISTNHTGLYEKYGYEFYKIMKDIANEDSRVYIKNLAKNN